MRVKIQRSVEIRRSARTLQLLGLFDVPPSERSERAWEVDLPLEGTDWRIGLIVGPSGSGKTTLAREAFPGIPFVSVGVGYDWPDRGSVVDGFPEGLGIKEITGALSSVGFSSPPAWLRPFSCLSTGEQFRATVARVLCDPSPCVVVDEFTSVVDRTVARIGSAAVARAIRRTPGKQIVCVTCHEDVEEWLCPDWIVAMPAGEFARRSLRPGSGARPAIELEVCKVRHTAWQLFKAHHYMSGEHANHAHCFLGLVEGRPAAFCSVIHYPSVAGGFWKEHRTVVIPDFQGVGLGNRLSEYVASLFVATGKKYFDVTAHPAHVGHRARSPPVGHDPGRQPGQEFADQQAQRPDRDRRQAVGQPAHLLVPLRRTRQPGGRPRVRARTMKLRSFVSAKLHGLTVTARHPDYHGSQTIPREVLRAAGILPYERVLCVNQANGERWETYAIPGDEGECTLNGAAAFKGLPGDRIIVMTFVQAERYEPARVLFFTPDNRIRETLTYDREEMHDVAGA